MLCTRCNNRIFLWNHSLMIPFLAPPHAVVIQYTTHTHAHTINGQLDPGTEVPFPPLHMGTGHAGLLHLPQTGANDHLLQLREPGPRHFSSWSMENVTIVRATKTTSETESFFFRIQQTTIIHDENTQYRPFG